MSAITFLLPLFINNVLFDKSKPVKKEGSDGKIDKVRGDHRNPLDKTAGEGAEFFSAESQEWQPTASNGKGDGGYVNFGPSYRESIDHELVYGGQLKADR